MSGGAAATTKSSRASMAGAVGSRVSMADEVEPDLELSDGFKVAAGQMTRRRAVARSTTLHPLGGGSLSPSRRCAAAYSPRQRGRLRTNGRTRGGASHSA
jgi:hypothetical protein